MEEKNMTNVNPEENESPDPADKKPAEEKKPKIRQRIGKWLQKEKLIELSPKAKKVTGIVVGGIAAAGAAACVILMKRHFDADGIDAEPVGMLPEEDSFELAQDEFVIEDVVDQT